MNTAPARPLQVTPRGVFATLLVFAVAALCVRFGFWQLDRLEQRRERNEQTRERLSLAPDTLFTPPRDSSGWLHRRVAIVGTFDNPRTIVFPGRALDGVPGAHVVTPVLVADGSAILADRGWVPAADGATVDLEALELGTLAADSALVLPFPGQERSVARGSAQSRGDSAFRRVWYALDESALRAQFPYQLGAVHVRLLPTADRVSLPRREPVPDLAEGPHLGYAIQWFSFAIIAIVGWFALVLKSQRAADSARSPAVPR